MFKLTIETSNAAFGETLEERGAELARILRALANRLERGTVGLPGDRGPLGDINGNKVGNWEFN